MKDGLDRKKIKIRETKYKKYFMNSNIIKYTTDTRNVNVLVQYEDGTFWITPRVSHSTE